MKRALSAVARGSSLPTVRFRAQQRLVEQCADFVEAHPSRFVFLACGAPRQEILAHRISQRGRASGIGLCIGAAVDQIGGHETRAPVLDSANGLEWGWRLGRDPLRMGRRYLADTNIVMLLLAEARRSRAERLTARVV